jgi:predicted GIY-YIG superfamily endonuclease
MERTAIYIMHDPQRSLYKIGIAKDPTSRVKTIKSTYPFTELKHYTYVPNRETAFAFERSLHDFLDSQRIEGEWFDLTSDQVESLQTNLIKVFPQEEKPKYCGKEKQLNVFIPEELLRKIQRRKFNEDSSIKGVVIAALEAYLEDETT